MQAEADEGHLTAGKEPLFTGKVARRRAGTALQARLKRCHIQAVGPEKGAVGAGGEIERPVPEQARRACPEEANRIHSGWSSGESRLSSSSSITLLQCCQSKRINRIRNDSVPIRASPAPSRIWVGASRDRSIVTTFPVPLVGDGMLVPCIDGQRTPLCRARLGRVDGRARACAPSRRGVPALRTRAFIAARATSPSIPTDAYENARDAALLFAGREGSRRRRDHLPQHDRSPQPPRLSPAPQSR